MLPVISDPDLVTVLELITAVKDGTLAGGPELLPGDVDQLPPQLGGVLLSVLANPLKLAGAAPPLSEFTFDHCAPQNVTDPVSVWSPTTKEPWSRKAKINVCAVAEDGK
jgi:hypothetical protein